MKKLTQLLTALVFGSLMIFISCGGGGDDGPDEVDGRIELGNNLVSVVSGSPSSVTFDGAARDEWDSFSIAFTFDGTSAGTYTVSGVPTNDGADAVWGASDATGTWAFNDDGSVITGSGISDLTPSITANSVSLTFSNDAAGGRAAAFEGAWVFTW